MWRSLPEPSKKPVGVVVDVVGTTTRALRRLWRRVVHGGSAGVPPTELRRWVDVWDADLALGLSEARRAALCRGDLENCMRLVRESGEFRDVISTPPAAGVAALRPPARLSDAIPPARFDAAWEQPPWTWLGIRPSSNVERRWFDRVATARSRKSSLRIAVIALVRDSADTIDFWQSTLARWLAGWGEATILLLENDSQDGTVAKLDAWRRREPRLRVLGRADLPATVLDLCSQSATEKTATRNRIARMAALRNAVFDAVRMQSPAPDFVCWIDMDRVGIFSECGWLHGLSHLLDEPDIDAVFPQALDPNLRYYDSLALVYPREPHVVHEETCRLTMPYKAVHARWFPADGDALVPVKSAFGGMGWYRWDSARRHAYAGHEDDRRSCEHSFLNINLAVGIDPWWITVSS